jgi:hypothetical protein
MPAGLAPPLTGCWLEYAPYGSSHAVNAGPSAGEVGEPAAVQLGFDVHGLGKLHTHYFESYIAHLADSFARFGQSGLR